jgi:hypothetical protein
VHIPVNKNGVFYNILIMDLWQYVKVNTCVDDVTALQCVLAPLHVVADHQEQRVDVFLTIVTQKIVEPGILDGPYMLFM